LPAAGLRPWPGACLSLLLVAAILAGCVALPGKPGSGDGDPFDRLAGGGWRIAEPVRSFGPDTLYEEIDGEAELYLPYSFRELRVAILSPAGRPAAQLRLELYRHGNPRDAYGIYSQYRFPGQETLSLASSEAIVSASSLDFFRGDTMVRIRTASREATREDLVALGRSLLEILPGTGDPPPEARALKRAGAVEGIVVFHRRALLGYEALAPGFEAKVREPGGGGTIFLAAPGETGPPKTFLSRLSAALPGFAPVGEGLYRADLPSGTLWLLFRGGYCLGMAGRVDRAFAESILARVGRELEQVSGPRENVPVGESGRTELK